MTPVFEWREAPRAQYAVIGDPISHSRSPQMHHAAYAALGLDLRYVAIRVPVGEVSEALEHLRSIGYQGVNVTVPHKEEAFRWARWSDSTAARLGAVNTLRLEDRYALNTDIYGLIETVGDAVPGGGRAWVLGAGGTARAAILALQELDFEVVLTNRTAAKGESLAAEFGAVYQLAWTASGFDVILNTTSTGLAGEALPIDWTGAEGCQLAYDMAYGGPNNPFLAEATKRGISARDGLDLLVAQGALALEFWLGQHAPRAQMAAAVREA